MAVSDTMQRLTERGDRAVAERKEQLTQAAENAWAAAEFVVASRPRARSRRTRMEAERAVDRLSDQGFPVERSAIVGLGLRSVEQVTGRMTAGSAALIRILARPVAIAAMA